MDQLPVTITCPYCGNVNQFSLDSCIKCKKSLLEIKNAMGFPASNMNENNEINTSKNEVFQIPKLPSIRAGSFRTLRQDSFLIRNSAEKDVEIISRFFTNLTKKNIPGIETSIGSIEVEGGQEREYFFITKNLGTRKFIFMAIRISRVGPDLFIDLKNCVHPAHARYVGWWWLLFLWGGIFYTLFFYNPNKVLQGFEFQESESLNLSIQATLHEALDQAGIPPNLVQKDASNVNIVKVL